MKLDVGCGNNPKGEVNCDLFIGDTPHKKNTFINPHNIPNFVKCDANFLPFKNNVFTECSMDNVLEHKGVRPLKVIKEMLRVTNGIITIIVPHRFAEAKTKNKCGLHGRTFNVSTLNRLLKNMNLIFDVDVNYKCFPHKFLCLVRLPDEIVVRIRCVS